MLVSADGYLFLRGGACFCGGMLVSAGGCMFMTSYSYFMISYFLTFVNCRVENCVCVCVCVCVFLAALVQRVVKRQTERMV